MHERREVGQARSTCEAAEQARLPAAEAVEGRGLAKGNTASKTRPGRRAGVRRAKCAGSRAPKSHRRTRTRGSPRSCTTSTSTACGRPTGRFSPKAAPGVDGVTWQDYGQELEANLRDLHGRVHRGSYRAKPSGGRTSRRRTGGSGRSGVAALEDKILQRAVVEVLNAIYETDFLGFSYGFRPGRSPHHALDALAVGIERKKVNWVLDADIRDFFTSLDHGWLLKFLEHRIADRRVLRLIRKWLSAGVIEDGEWSETVEGTPQGASVSPLLANVYLHYVFDLWAQQWRRRHAHGDVIIVRFADDFVVGFEHQEDAERFLADLRERFAKFAWSCSREDAPDRVRAVRRPSDGRRGASGSRRRSTSSASRTSAGRPGTGGSGSGASRSRSGCGPSCARSKTELKRRRHLPVPEQGRWLASVVRGHLAYYAVPGNSDAVDGVPHPGDQALVSGATAPQPAHTA